MDTAAAVERVVDDGAEAFGDEARGEEVFPGEPADRESRNDQNCNETFENRSPIAEELFLTCSGLLFHRDRVSGIRHNFKALHLREAIVPAC